MATGCRAIEDIIITILMNSPNLALTAFATTACQTPTGSIRIIIQPLTQTTQPPYPYVSYFVVGGVSTFVEGQNSGTYTVPSLTGGTYSVLLSDEITGCAVSNTVTVNDQLNTLSAPGLTTCTESPIVAITDAATNPSAGNFRYAVFDTFGTQVDAKNNINASPFSTNPLPPGTYTLQVTRN